MSGFIPLYEYILCNLFLVPLEVQLCAPFVVIVSQVKTFLRPKMEYQASILMFQLLWSVCKNYFFAELSTKQV